MRTHPEGGSARRRFLPFPLLSIVLLVSACGEDLAAPPPLLPDNVRAYVSDELAAHLTANGTFVLPPPASEPYPQLTPDGSAELALVYARTFGPYLRDYLERYHGRSIDFATLRVGSPAYYASTPYAPTPDTVDAGARNAFGPYYLVYLVAPDGRPVLVAEVAARSEITIENGQLKFPLSRGSDVRLEAIAPGRGFMTPPSPERAVQIAGAAAGAHATAVPELLLPGRPFSPAYARWRVALDRPVVVRGRRTGLTRSLRELYVGVDGDLSIPEDTQPSFGSFTALNGETVRIGVRPGRPLAFESVTIAR